MPRTVLKPISVLSPMKKVMTAPVTRDIMINTLTQLPEEATVKGKDVVAKYVYRGLETVTLSMIGHHIGSPCVSVTRLPCSLKLMTISLQFSKQLWISFHLKKRR
jgi:hypothetical protein